MLNTERVGLLANALRSGEFLQGIGRLRREGCHCAEGVACEVYRRETGDGEWQRSPGGGGDWYLTPDGIVANRAATPARVRDWYGFEGPGVVVRLDGRETDRITGMAPGFHGDAWGLATMNDRATPFPVIAELLEASVRQQERGLRGLRSPAGEKEGA